MEDFFKFFFEKLSKKSPGEGPGQIFRQRNGPASFSCSPGNFQGFSFDKKYLQMKTAHFTKFVHKSQRHKSVTISDKMTQKLPFS